uniref:Tenascin-like protein n=1 Tax=Cacopsylla melanoneura TaxID=428564 RepID=A0A8D8XG00_9HEMI
MHHSQYALSELEHPNIRSDYGSNTGKKLNTASRYGPSSMQDACNGSQCGSKLPSGGMSHHQMGNAPVVMPVFPLRPTESASHYSPYSPSRFNVDDSYQYKFSWKYCSIALIILSCFLTAISIYLYFAKSLLTSPDCIPRIDDLKAVAHENLQTFHESTTFAVDITKDSISNLTTGVSSSGPIGMTDFSQVPDSYEETPSVVELKDFNSIITATIPSFQFWNSDFNIEQSVFFRFNFDLPRGSNFAVYGRRNVAPSITNYDFSEFIKGGKINQKRSVDSILDESVSFTSHLSHHTMSKRSESEVNFVQVHILKFLTSGKWFLSVYNDDVKTHEIKLLIKEAEGVSSTCPNGCSGHGSCYLGNCDCIDGYEGTDCSKSVCPVLCSNHGKYGGGICHCENGWKGAECDIPATDCQYSDCSGHGSCIEGLCQCQPGWKGIGCQEVDCLDPICSNHGICHQGKCFCKAGWQGVSCEQVDKQVFQCLPTCSEHGMYDLTTSACSCDPLWTGSDCSQALCNLDCGRHGTCDQGKCLCDKGWTGEKCDQLPCDWRCQEHGQCKNGTCVCSQGWNGKHCTLPGCPNACNRHGTCSFENEEYKCVCSEGWAGVDCNIKLEMSCNDETDNDKDGVTDCSDSDCCSQPVCSDQPHIMCLASNDPVEVLLRKQPPSVTASFYQRVKFLVEENSVQSYAHMDEYSERRVAVVRGQVLSVQGLGITGIRVSVDKDSGRFGFTLTRGGGWFDMLVNGGGAVTLQFQRSPYRPQTRTVFIPWNQIVVLPPVHMQLSDASDIFRETAIGVTPSYAPTGSMENFASNFLEPCLAHDEVVLSPVIVSTWMPEKIGGLPGRSLVFAETQILQESIQIPGSDLHLTYRSSLSSGYLSSILIHLTHAEIPSTLDKVHVRVEIEGSVHTKTYEADPNLTHVFTWNKRNVYKQKVYGVAQCKISIGYKHESCSSIVWETQTCTLQGFDVDISDIGGWSLDVHHHYNFHEGILQKGDGSSLHLKHEFPRTVSVVMGTGLQRPLVCKDCDGVARDARLLTPVALTSGPDGSLYVGDFNLVRRLTPEGNVFTVLQLSATQVSYQYYLALSPADGHLYISDAEKHQILRVLSLESVTDPSINWEVAVGSGERCIPGDETNCGDNGPALSAKLSHPKGLTIKADKTMFIADGTNIRVVNPEGIIHTLIGHHKHHNMWSPFNCHRAFPASTAQLQWPTGLALSPLDDTLHFIDDRVIFKLTNDLKVKIVAGIPLHCRTSDKDKERVKEKLRNTKKSLVQDDSVKASNMDLGSLTALAFSPSGDLYIADIDARKVNALRVIDSTGRMFDFAGRWQSDKRNCNTTSCVEFEKNSKETLLTSTARFTTISALSVSSDGVVNVADQGSLHILALQHYLPTHDEHGEFKIPYPATNEIYVFNRYGQHITTRDMTSGKPRYSFLYSKNTSFGKLSTITDASGNKINFLRDYSNVVSAIENTQDHKSELNISGVGLLTRFVEKGKTEIELNYHANTGLLSSRYDSTIGGGATFQYEYDEHGRISKVILPTGETLNYGVKLSPYDELEVQMGSSLVTFEHLKHSPYTVNMSMSENQNKLLTLKDGFSGSSDIISHRNGSFSFRNSLSEVSECTKNLKHPILKLSLPVEAEILPLCNKQTLQRGPYTNVMMWNYTLVGDAGSNHQTLFRHLLVNNTHVLGVKYEQAKALETVYDKFNNALLKISYAQTGLPMSWQVGNFLSPVMVKYDRFNRLEQWQWGEQLERYSYKRHGLIDEIHSKQDGATKFSYNELHLLSNIQLPTGRKFTFMYDEQSGLRHIVLPSGTRHSFSAQPSFGFIRYTYTLPGSSHPYLQHYTAAGGLLQTVFPAGARILYRYYDSGQLAEIVHGDGATYFKWWLDKDLPSQILHSDREFEYRLDMQFVGSMLTEQRIDFGPKSGLNNAKLTYEYDSNFRISMIQGRIGGQSLMNHPIEYNAKTGAKQLIGQFTINWPQENEMTLSDMTASFTRIKNQHFQESSIAITIHGMEVFRMEFGYDLQNRVNQIRTHTRNIGVNTYLNVKNYTYDTEGQLVAVAAQEPWGFHYDSNGNMLSLIYRGNTISMAYSNLDRIEKFGDGIYLYNSNGLVVQNAREENFHYNAKGLLIRAMKKGRFDVTYDYDHLDRLSVRKDNYGNITQFFYNNHEYPTQVTHIYSPRYGKLISLVYDDRGFLIFAQMFRHKYYIATDQCGTPVMVFNQYGETVREIMRSPYGHIVYDSNPYIYLPIDFCGGLLDQVTSLVHMPNGKIYDPLIGQWMSPQWENILDRLYSPRHLHPYRFNGNDPINAKIDTRDITDERLWLSKVGYSLSSLVPQMNMKTDILSKILPTQYNVRVGLPFGTASGFLSHLTENLQNKPLTSLSNFKANNVPRRAPFFYEKYPHDPLQMNLYSHRLSPILNKIFANNIGSSAEPPLGSGIIISRSSEGRAIVHSIPKANSIYRDVFTSVFNNTFILPFTTVVHGTLQDTIYFIKEDSWRSAEDKNQLKRLGSQFNITFHSEDRESKSDKVLDVRIHRTNTIINLRYGTTPDREKQRLLHHAKTIVLNKAWHKEREYLKIGLPTTRDWVGAEIDEIYKVGHLNNYDVEYIRDIQKYPELAYDPYNIKFVKKSSKKNKD